MKMKMRFCWLLTLSCAAALAGEYSAQNYVTNGLVAQFDAIENVAYGVHDSAIPYWVNLRGTGACGNLPLSPLKSYSWDADCLNLTSGNTEKAIFVVEFKYGRSADAALAQCREKRYADACADDGRRVVYVGVNYDPQVRTVDDVKTEQVDFNFAAR